MLHYPVTRIKPITQAFKLIQKNSYLSCKSFKQVPFPIFPKKKFCILTCERKTGTPAFQKTDAKEIKNL
jgi:hypothetical protein